MKIREKLNGLLQSLHNKEESDPMTTKEKWMLLLLAGVLLAVIILPVGKTDTEKKNLFQEERTEQKVNTENIFANMENGSLYQYAEYLSDKLDGILGQIDGVGKVKCWVTLSGSGEEVLYEEKDGEQKKLEEADSVGGIRKEEESKTKRTVLKDQDGNPYVIKTLQPEVEGVLVVAEGAGNSSIKKNITEAVQVLFGVESHRIKVVKKKAEG